MVSAIDACVICEINEDKMIMKKNQPYNIKDNNNHSILKSIILHLFPGLLVLISIIIITPLLEKYNLPLVLVLIFSFGFILIPFELGYMLYQGKKRNGKFSLKGIILFKEAIPKWQYIIYTIPVIIWIFLVYGVLAPPIDNFIIEKLFSWIPEIYFLNMDFNLYSQSALFVMWIAYLGFNCILAPLIEELYFRGYLLPKISDIGKWAPILNIILFSLYHFFSPWQNPVRIIALFPMVYLVWWKKNVYLGIIIHGIVNTLGAIAMLPTIFASG